MGECSFWQFLAAKEGWQAVHGGEPQAQAPSPEEHDEMVARFA